MKKGLLLFLLLLSFQLVISQVSSQSVKGSVLEADSELPLIGVQIILLNSDPLIGSTTDIDGNFEIENVPVGHHDFQATYLGYKAVSLSNILVTAGKQVVLNIEMEEEFQEIDEVVIKAKRTSHSTATTSVSKIDQKFIGSVAGSRNDPANSVKSLAGVGAANDTRNDIIIRGNSPTGLLWKMEGVPIPSPNHFSTLGTTGGPVGALNTNLLSTSDFLTSAFPAEYGNATSGVFDVRLRNGNKDKFEHTLQMAAFSGLEFMTEGPLSKKHNSSYLLSYRFSITGIIPNIISISPVYQDVNFKFDLPNSKKAGKFSIFGLIGTSKINFLGEDIDEDDLFANPNEDAYVTSRVGIVGVTHNKILKSNNYIRNAFVASLSQSFYDQDNFDSTKTKVDVIHAKDLTNRYVWSTYYNKKASSRFTYRTGITAHLFDLVTQFQDRAIGEDFTFKRDFDGFIGLFEAFYHAKYKLSDRVTMNAGLHGQFMTLSNSWSIEPRLGFKFQVSEKNSFSFGYGMHSQMQPFPIYFYQEELVNGQFNQSNRMLDFTRSQHFVLGHEFTFADDWRLKSEVYYQYLHNAGVESKSSSFSVLNAGADFIFPERTNLVNDGTGFNAGLEVTLEKFFSNGYYGLFTGSLFTSRYKGSDDILRNTTFDNTYIVNFLAGKEFKVGPEKRQAFLIDFKITSAGGRFYTPIDESASQAAEEEILIEDEAYSLRYEPYFKMDFKVGIRFNAKKRKYSQQFFIDLQNITNRENIFVQKYNEVTNQVNRINQDGFFADVLFRIQF